MNNNHLELIQKYQRCEMTAQEAADFEAQLKFDNALSKTWYELALYRQAFMDHQSDETTALTQLDKMQQKLGKEDFFAKTEEVVKAKRRDEATVVEMKQSRWSRIYRLSIAASFLLLCATAAWLWTNTGSKPTFDPIAYTNTLQIDKHTMAISGGDSIVQLMQELLKSGESHQVLSIYTTKENKTLDVRLAAAQAYIQLGQFDNALPLLEGIISNPVVRDIHKYRAMYDAALCCFYRGDKKQANVYLNQVITAAKIAPEALQQYEELANQKLKKWSN